VAIVAAARFRLRPVFVSSRGAGMSSSKPIDFVLRAAWLAALLAVLTAVVIPAGVAGTDAAPVQSLEVQTLEVQTLEVQTLEVQTLEVDGTRFKITLADIAARWPRLAGKTGAICTEEFARSQGALLVNRSVP
jgi:hypothetical protein